MVLGLEARLFGDWGAGGANGRFKPLKIAVQISRQKGPESPPGGLLDQFLAILGNVTWLHFGPVLLKYLYAEQVGAGSRGGTPLPSVASQLGVPFMPAVSMFVCVHRLLWTKTFHGRCCVCSSLSGVCGPGQLEAGRLEAGRSGSVWTLECVDSGVCVVVVP